MALTFHTGFDYFMSLPLDELIAIAEEVARRGKRKNIRNGL